MLGCGPSHRHADGSRHRGRGRRHGNGSGLGDVMRKKPVTIQEDRGILDAAKAFARTGVRRLPVVSATRALIVREAWSRWRRGAPLLLPRLPS